MKTIDLLRYLLISALLVGLIAINAGEITFAQPTPATESLDQIVNLFLNQTLEKFDAAFFQNRIVTGTIKSSELSFYLKSGQQTTYKTDEIAALVLDTSKGEIVLRSGERFLGQLLTALEIAPAGFENQWITLVPVVLGTIVFKGQHRYLVSNAEFGMRFQWLLINHLRHSMTRRDVLVFKNDSVLAGTVTNPVFQIDDLYFNKETVAEITFGLPDQLRTKAGQIVKGVIRNPAVTLQLTSYETRFSFATQVLVRVFFEDAGIRLAPEEMRGTITQISEGL